MSLNAAISQHYLPEVQGLLQLLEKYITRWASAPTIEQRILIESDAISTFERLLDQEFFMNEVLAGDHPDFTEMGRVYGDLWLMLEINSAKIQTLSEMFLKRFNSQSLAMMELTSTMKRIRQKRATLTLWTRDRARFVTSEHFLNFDNIGSRFTSIESCDVDTNQGVLTLPIRNRLELTPVRAAIGSGSNGIPGNSDIEVQTNNGNPQYAINNQPANWFEYERLDSGPLVLTYIVEFTNPEIMNQITIEPVSLGLSLSYEVLDITFTLSGGQEVSIKDLVSETFDSDFFVVKSSGNDISWVLSFLPVEATAVAIKLRQNQAYQIPIVTNDNRTVLRDRYTIALKDVSFFRIEYETEGGINSKALDLPGGLYSAASFADYWPHNPNLFTTSLELSLNGGETWMSPGNDPLNGEVQLMQGNERSLIWRVSLRRDDAAFENATAFIEDDNPIYETESLLRNVSRFQSPVEITLPETPLDGKVFVLQPQIARRGDKYKGIFIGEGSGHAVGFELPVNILEQGIDADTVRIFVERREYDRAEDNTVIGTTEWAFSDDYREVIFGSALDAGSNVTMVLDEEIMSVEALSDGYYHQMKLLFDPDKENVDVYYIPRNLQRKTHLLPRNKKIIDLGATNILRGTLTLSSGTGLTYTAVSSKSDVFDAADQDYFVDWVNGVLYLATETGADTVRATFAHKSKRLMSKDDFEIVIVENRPWGIRINKNAFQGQSHTDTVGGTLSKVIDVITGAYGQREDLFSGATDAMTLSYDCIVKGTLSVSDGLLGTTTPPEEVDFIDGKTEFLGLIPMERESTVSIQSTGSLAYVEFKLAAGALWYQNYNVLFDDATTFANKVSSRAAAQAGSIGDYFVNGPGLVTVNIGTNNTLPSGIGINYYYRDPAFDPVNKYSVDYTNGILYADSSVVDDETITYKASCYKVAYDIANHIRSQQYVPEDRVVKVRTESLAKINNLVKVIWTKAPPVSDLAVLRNYFTPLIYVLAFRFN